MSLSMEDKSSHNELYRNAETSDAERTLRMIASLPAPKGLENRVKSALRSAPSRTRIVEWPFSSAQSGWTQRAGTRAAAAAAIVLAITGGGWTVYSHIKPAALPTAISTTLPLGGAGFSAAAARRVPQTLERPVVAKPVATKEKHDAEGSGAVPLKRGKPLNAKKSIPSSPSVR